MLSGFVSRMAASTPAAAMIMPMPIRTSLAVGGTAVRPSGRSAVSAASSARDREADAWAVRSSCSAPGQPALRQRSREGADHPFAVGVRYRQEATAGHYLLSRLHHDCPPERLPGREPKIMDAPRIQNTR